jgi:RNA-directed DNA polymerase
MNWKKYRKEFHLKATSKHLDSESIKRALVYARPLHKAGLPIIYSQQHLSLLVGYNIDFLRRASNAKSTEFYRCFEIKKKSSDSMRTISEPLPTLKEIQRWILDNILNRVTISKFAKAYVLGLSIKDNARFHRGQKQVLRVDVKDFFPSITGKNVFYIFKNLGYSAEVSSMLTGLTTLKNSLPQGAPTSPTLSNIFMTRCDARIAGYCLGRKIRYTRYADDLTYSGEFNVGKLVSFVNFVLRDSNLFLNKTKTKHMRKHQRQFTTGLVVNKNINVCREKRRKLRQEIYYIKKFGLDGHLNRIHEKRSNYIMHLLGLSNFILHINAEDRDAQEAKNLIKEYTFSVSS